MAATRPVEELPMAALELEDGPALQNGGSSGPREEGQKLMQYLAGFLATLGALAAGTVLAWTSPTLDALQAKDSFLPVTPDEGSWIGSLTPIGACLGAVPAGPLTDKLGRKVTMMALSVPFVISWLLILFAGNVPTLYAARFIGGVATGATSVAVPMYVGEIAEPSIRGTLGSFFQLQVTIGFFLSFTVGGFASYTALASVSLAVPVLWLAAVFFLPETPVFLLKQHKTREVETSLRRLRGKAYRGIHSEVGDMLKDFEKTARNDSSLGEIFKSRAVIKALIICLGLMVFQQVSGINAVLFYTVKIFKLAGSTLEPKIATIIVSVVQVVGTLCAALLVERAGRRLLLLASAAVMAAMHVVLGVYFYMHAGGADLSSLGWLPLLCVMVFVFVFSLAFGPIPWMMAGDLFSDEVYASASTIAAAVNWITAFAVTKMFNALLDNVGTAGTFWIFGGCCVAATAFVAVLVFETKDKSKAEVQAILSSR